MPVSAMAKQAVATTKGREHPVFTGLIKEGGREGTFGANRTARSFFGKSGKWDEN